MSACVTARPDKTAPAALTGRDLRSRRDLTRSELAGSVGPKVEVAGRAGPRIVAPTPDPKHARGQGALLDKVVARYSARPQMPAVTGRPSSRMKMA
jgi:hypothetical protein